MADNWDFLKGIANGDSRATTTDGGEWDFLKKALQGNKEQSQKPEGRALGFFERHGTEAEAATGVRPSDAYDDPTVGKVMDVAYSVAPFTGKAARAIAGKRQKSLDEAMKTGDASGMFGGMDDALKEWDATEGRKYDLYQRALNGEKADYSPIYAKVFDRKTGRYKIETDGSGLMLLDDRYAMPKDEARRQFVKELATEQTAQTAEAKANAAEDLANNTAAWYMNLAHGATASLGFAGEFYLGGALAKGAMGTQALAATKLGKAFQAAEKGAKLGFKASAAKTAAEIAAPTLANAVARYEGLTANDYGIDANGDLVLTAEADGAIRGAAKALGGAAFENATEVALGKGVNLLVKNGIGGAFKGIYHRCPKVAKLFDGTMAKIGDARIDGAKKAWTDAVKAYAKVQNAAHFEIMPVGEFAEEYVQGWGDEVMGFGNRATEKDASLGDFTKNFFDWDAGGKDLFFGIMGQSIALGGGAYATLRGKRLVDSVNGRVIGTLKQQGYTASDIATMSAGTRLARASMEDPRIAQELGYDIIDLARMGGVREKDIESFADNIKKMNAEGFKSLPSDEQQKVKDSVNQFAEVVYGASYAFSEGMENAEELLSHLGKSMQKAVRLTEERQGLGNYRDNRTSKVEDFTSRIDWTGTSDGAGNLNWQTDENGRTYLESRPIDEDGNGVRIYREGDHFRVVHPQDAITAGHRVADLKEAHDWAATMDRYAQKKNRDREVMADYIRFNAQRLVPTKTDKKTGEQYGAPVMIANNAQDALDKFDWLAKGDIDALQTAMTNGNEGGGYKTSDGTVIMFLDNLKDANDALLTLSHEIGGHLAAKEGAKAKGLSLVDTVAEVFKGSSRKDAAAYKGERRIGLAEGETNEDATNIAQEEALVYGNERRTPYATPLQKAKTAVKLWLKERGMDAKLTDADFDAIAAAGLQRIRMTRTGETGTQTVDGEGLTPTPTVQGTDLQNRYTYGKWVSDYRQQKDALDAARAATDAAEAAQRHADEAAKEQAKIDRMVKDEDERQRILAEQEQLSKDAEHATKYGREMVADVLNGWYGKKGISVEQVNRIVEGATADEVREILDYIELEMDGKASDGTVLEVAKKINAAIDAEIAAERKRIADRKEIARRQAAPLKGGVGEIGQSLMDLGGAEGEDLFNRTGRWRRANGISDAAHRSLGPNFDHLLAISQAKDAPSGKWRRTKEAGLFHGTMDEYIAKLRADKFADGETTKSGAQSIVKRVGDKVVKFRNGDLFDAEMLANIAKHNELFPDTPYTVVGVTEENGRQRIILEQPYIDIVPNSGTEARRQLVKQLQDRFGADNVKTRGDIGERNLLAPKSWFKIDAGPWHIEDLKDLNLGIDRADGKVKVWDAEIAYDAAKDAEGKAQGRWRRVGTREDGIPQYETDSFFRHLTMREKRRCFKDTISYTMRNRDIVIGSGADSVVARIEHSDQKKLVGSMKGSSERGAYAKSNLFGERDIEDVLSNLSYIGGERERGKQTVPHRSVSGWAYYRGKIEVDGEDFYATAALRSVSGEWKLYDIELNEKPLDLSGGPADLSARGEVGKPISASSGSASSDRSSRPGASSSRSSSVGQPFVGRGGNAVAEDNSGIIPRAAKDAQGRWRRAAVTPAEDAGDVIPLSERFNAEKSDIRWRRNNSESNLIWSRFESILASKIPAIQDKIEKVRRLAEKDIKNGGGDSPIEMEIRSSKKRIADLNKAIKRYKEHGQTYDVERYKQYVKEEKDNLRSYEENLGSEDDVREWYSSHEIIEILDAIEDESLVDSPFVYGGESPEDETTPFSESFSFIKESYSWKELGDVLNAVEDSYKEAYNDVVNPRGPFGEALSDTGMWRRRTYTPNLAAQLLAEKRVPELKSAKDGNAALVTAEKLARELAAQGSIDPVLRDLVKATKEGTPVQIAKGNLAALASSQAFSRWREILQDAQIALKEMEAKYGVKTDASAYAQFDRNYGLVKDAMDKFYREIYEPLTKELKDNGVKADDFDAYLRAKHGPERNRMIAERSPYVLTALSDKRTQAIVKDILSGARDLDDAAILDISKKLGWVDKAGNRTRESKDFEDDLRGSGATTAHWNNVLAKFAADGLTPKMLGAEKLVRELTQRNRDLLVQTGRLSSDQAALWEKLSPNYVPLKSDMEMDSNVWTKFLLGGGADKGGTGGRRYSDREYNHAYGRGTIADSPLAFAIQQYEESLNRAYDNVARQRLAALVRTNPNMGKVFRYLSDTERADLAKRIAILTNIAKTRLLTSAELDALKKMQDKLTEASNADKSIPTTKILGANGIMHEVPTLASIEGTKQSPTAVIAFKENGELKFIRLGGFAQDDVNNDPQKMDDVTARRIATAVKKQNMAELGEVGKWIRKATGLFSALRTAYSPTFLVSNLGADNTQAMRNIYATFGGKGAVQFEKYAFHAFKAAAATLSGNYGTTKIMRYAQEWAENGGKIGGLATDQIGDLQKKMARDIRRLYSQTDQLANIHNVKDFVSWANDKRHGFSDLVEKMNGIVEMSTRIAAYATARDMGQSVNDAVAYSRDITVNFNRKGTATPWINALYAFSNATMQDIHRSLVAFGEGRTGKGLGILAGRGAKMGFGLMVLGFLSSMLGFWQDDPEDEQEGKAQYKNTKEWQKQNVMGIRIGGKTVGVPIRGLSRLPYYLGHQVYEAMSGRKGVGKMAADTVGLAIGNATDFLGQASTPLNVLTPSVARTPVDIYINKTFTGQKMYREPMSNTDVRSEMGRGTTSSAAKWIARALNRMGGGNEGRRGSILGMNTDFQPEKVAEVWNWLTGSAGKDIANITGTAKDVATGDIMDRPLKNIPYFSRFIRSLDENSARYYEARDAYDAARKEYKTLIALDRTEDAQKVLDENPWLSERGTNRRWGTDLNEVKNFVSNLLELEKKADGEDYDTIHAMRLKAQYQFMRRMEQASNADREGMDAERELKRRAMPFLRASKRAKKDAERETTRTKRSLIPRATR